MNIGEIHWNIEVVEDLRDQLTNVELQKILNRYCESLDQIVTTLAVPTSFMAHGLRKSKAFHFSVQDAMTVVVNKDGQKENDPKKTAKELVEYFEKLILKHDENIVEHASIEIDLIMKNVPLLKQLYMNLGLNALVNSWTVFEAICKGLWVFCLNTYPKDFVFQVLNANKLNENEIFGLNGKQISIGLLAKYDFDISKNLGSILSPKYDFTSARGIKSSFKDLFNFKKNELHFFDNRSLNQLEITRHIVVHNAGRIDKEYLKRSKYDGEVLNEKLDLTSEEISDLVNAGIKTMRDLFLLVEKNLNNS